MVMNTINVLKKPEDKIITDYKIITIEDSLQTNGGRWIHRRLRGVYVLSSYILKWIPSLKSNEPICHMDIRRIGYNGEKGSAQILMIMEKQDNKGIVIKQITMNGTKVLIEWERKEKAQPKEIKIGKNIYTYEMFLLESEYFYREDVGKAYAKEV